MKAGTNSGELASRPALRLLFTGLALGVVPLFAQISPLPLLILLFSLAGRLRASGFWFRIPPGIARVIIGALGFGGIWLSYGSFAGLEPGISVFVVLLSLKLVEARRPRDFQVLTLLGFFLCLTLLFFSQDFGTCLYMAGVLAVLVCALIESHGADARESWRLCGKLMVQAVPLAALLFVFFPRGYFGMHFQRRSSLFAQSGISERLSPGSVAAVALSDEVAFRAYFQDEQVPPPMRRYWRGMVLWRGYGMVWMPGPFRDIPESAPPLGGEAVRQQIILQPHGDVWLFALDRPASDIPGGTLLTGGVLRSNRPVYTSLRYDVVSRPENRETSLGGETRREALWLPTGISSRAESLVRKWRNSASSDEQLVETALQFFRKNGFVYTLRPGTYGDHSLDEFLFHRRAGFCEHYAAAFATLMRLAGIPSRIVIGYQGGEFNRLGNYLIVRQSDAHAWCEVWMANGWLRVDPTSVVAPARVTSGMTSFLESRTREGNGQNLLTESTGAVGMREIFRDVRLAWDNIRYKWDLYVLNFDDERQRNLLMLAGLESLRPPALIMTMAVAIGAAGIVAGVFVGWRSRPRRDTALQWFEKFCRKGARAGVPRDQAEGPLDYATRLSSHFPMEAAQIGAITSQYLTVRYGPGRTNGAGWNALRRAVRRLRLSRSRVAR